MYSGRPAAADKMSCPEKRKTGMIRSTISSAVCLCILFLGCSRQSAPISQDSTEIRTQISASCIARYYKTNGAVYITSQQHSFDPLTGYFQMKALEPAGQLQFTLNKNQYSEIKPKTAVLSDSPVSFCNAQLAAALFYSFCAGGDLLDTASLSSGEPIKLEGQWYQPLQTNWPNPPVVITLLRSLDTNRIELVGLDDADSGLSWLLRSYNLRYNKDLDKRIPRTIDVFDTRSGIASKQLMIQFDYKTVQSAQLLAAGKIQQAE